MEKTQLKKLIVGLKKAEQIKVTFIGDRLSSKSGEYIVTGTKKGRGKGGSLLLVLQSVDTNEELVYGTPDSDYVLNMTLPNGSFHGYKTEVEIPKIYPTNSAKAVALKEQLKELLTVENATVTIESDEPEFNGTFTLTNVEKMSGRYGQMVMNLVAQDGTKRELWSFRHSGIINKIMVNS